MKRKMIAVAVAAMTVVSLFAAEFPHREEWGRRFAVPEGFAFTHKATKIDSSERDGFTLETWRQVNGPESFQRVLVAVPKGANGNLPAVVVTVENVDSMFEANPADGVRFAADLAKRGYVTVSSDCGLSEKDMPGWFGMGRLVHNARLLVDFAEADGRIDKGRIGMAGHGAGAKVAFYGGLLDRRVKAVGVSFFSVMLSDPSWSESRFWGGEVAEMAKSGMVNLDILKQSDAKPVFFLRTRWTMEQPEEKKLFDYVRGDRQSKRNDVFRRYFWNRGATALDSFLVNEVYAFFDDYVISANNPSNAYQGGRVRLFESGDKVEGKVSKSVRIPAVVVAPDGSVVVAFDVRLWDGGDLWSCLPTRTAIMRSTDCGRTWSAPKILWNFPWNEEERYGASDPSLVVDHVANKVFCFVNVMEFVRERNVYRSFVWESSDNGVTWSEPRDITDDTCWPGIVPGRHLSFIISGHGIQRKDGALMHVKTAQRFGVNLFGSEDHGKTWKCIGNPTHGAIDESKVEVLADGTWMINCRHSWYRQICRSKDCGKTWSIVDDPNLPDSITNGATLVVPLKDGREVLLFCNSSRAVRPRSHITLKASFDGGYSWNKGVLIDPGACEYSDIALMTDGRVAVVYEKDECRTMEFVAVPLEEVLCSK